MVASCVNGAFGRPGTRFFLAGSGVGLSAGIGRIRVKTRAPCKGEKREANGRPGFLQSKNTSCLHGRRAPDELRRYRLHLSAPTIRLFFRVLVSPAACCFFPAACFPHPLFYPFVPFAFDSVDASLPLQQLASFPPPIRTLALCLFLLFALIKSLFPPTALLFPRLLTPTH